MMYTVSQRKGMVLVSGEVGAGKTFVGNMLGARLGSGAITCHLRNPAQSAKQLLRAFAGLLGLDIPPAADKLTVVEMLEQHLTRMHHRGRLVALLLDEAQNLPAPALEEVRMLWNWEVEGQRLVQLVLIGQPELREKIREPRWEPLRQRIVLSYHLRPLSRPDVARYVAHRLNVASGGECTAEFTACAIDEVHSATDGVPRLINVLCDNALLIGYTRGLRELTGEIIRHVVGEMTCWADRPAHSEAAAAATG
jgi:general secretion pathway protein A